MNSIDKIIGLSDDEYKNHIGDLLQEEDSLCHNSGDNSGDTIPNSNK